MKSVITRYLSVLFVIVLAFAFFTRVYRLDQPQGYVFDEVYHGVTAKLISRNDPSAYEWWQGAPEPNTAIDWLHPPLAKYTQALSILAFGENSFGWRFSSAIFGVMAIGMVYLLGKETFSPTVGLLAALLASLDGLLLVQSRIAMNDIHVTFFILVTLFLYVRSWKVPTHRLQYLLSVGIAAGLAAGSKWSGVYGLAVVWLFEGVRYLELLTSYDQKKSVAETIKTTGRYWGYRLLVLGVVPILLYVLSYSQMFLQGKSLFCNQREVVTNHCYLNQEVAVDGSASDSYISHFHELHEQIWWYQTTLEATHDYQSRPWQWFLNFRPVWYHVEYLGDSMANIYAFGNPLLFAFGDMAIFLTIILIVRQMKTIKPTLKGTTEFILNSKLAPILFVLTAYFAVWLPWQLSPRIMFFYHYTPAVPLLCIVLSWWLIQLAQKHPRVAVSAVLGVAVCFGLWYPLWTNLPVPARFANALYFRFASWR